MAEDLFKIQPATASPYHLPGSGRKPAKRSFVFIPHQAHSKTNRSEAALKSDSRFSSEVSFFILSLNWKFDPSVSQEAPSKDAKNMDPGTLRWSPWGRLSTLPQVRFSGQFRQDKSQGNSNSHFVDSKMPL